MLDDDEEEFETEDQPLSELASKKFVDIEKAIIGSFEKEIKDQTASLGAYAHSLVEDKKSELLGKYLGFDNRWGRWEVDHCNGRGGESAAGSFLKQELKRHSEDILKHLAGELPPLPAEAIKALRKEFSHELLAETKRLVQQAARDKARELVKNLVNDVIEKSDIKVAKLSEEAMSKAQERVRRGY